MILLLAACSTSPTVVRPASVPPQTPHLQFVEEVIQLDGQPLIPWKQLTEGAGAIEGLEVDSRGLWMSIPSTARWHDVQRLLGEILPHGPAHIGDLVNPMAVGPLMQKATGAAIVTCTEGPLKTAGVHQRLTLEVNADDGQAWVNASVRFLPIVERNGKQVVANLFQDECWAPTACDQLGASAAACASGTRVRETVKVAGSAGCFLPLGKGFRGHESWRQELTPVLQKLGFDEGADVWVMASEHVPFGAVLSVLSGLKSAGIEPQIGLLRMGSRSGPPICSIPTRDAAGLAAAGAAWYGQRSAQVLRGVQSRP